MKKKLNKEERVSRNKKSLDSFSKYCLENPNQRFFQALTNWFGAPKIGYLNGENWIDMWYMEEDVDYKV